MTNRYSRAAVLIGVLTFNACQYDDTDILQLNPLGDEQIAVLSALDHIAGLRENTGAVSDGGRVYEISRVAIVTPAGVDGLSAAFRRRGWGSVSAYRARCSDDVANDCVTTMQPNTLVLEVHYLGSDSHGRDHLVNIVASRVSPPPLDTIALDSAIAKVRRQSRLETAVNQEDVMSTYWDIVEAQRSEPSAYGVQRRGYMLRTRAGAGHDASVTVESAWSFSGASVQI